MGDGSAERRWRRMCLALGLALATACSGGDDDPSGPDTPGTGQQTIGPEGGSVTVDLGGGASARLVVPAGALAVPITVTLTGVARSSPDALAFILEPAPTLLAGRGTLEVTLPDGTSPDGQVLAFRDAAGLTLLGSRVGATSRTLRASLAALGPYPAEVGLPSGTLRASRAGGATVVATPLTLQERITAATQSLTALQSAERPSEAEAAGGAFASLAELHEAPGFRSATESLFQQWSTLSCQRFTTAQQAFSGAATDASFVFDGFVVQANRLLAWTRQLTEMNDLVSLPEVAVVPCQGDPNGVVSVIEAKVPSVVAAANQLYATVPVETTFGTLLDGSLVKIIGVQAYLATLNGGAGGGGLDTVVQLIWTRLRNEAFRQCRVGGSAYGRYHLLLLRMTDNPGLAGTALYAPSDLQDDLQVCGPDVSQTILSGPDAPTTAPPIRPGAEPGAAVLTAQLAMSPGDTLRLAGRLEALQCSPIVTSPEFNAETIDLVFRSGAQVRPVRTLTRDAGGRYLAQPADVVFDRDIAPLLTVEGAEGVLQLVRQGPACAPDDYFDTRNSTIIARVTIRRGNAPLVITSTSLPPATQDQPYSAQLTATGGTGPYTWSVANLPAGLTLNPSTGAITGTPTSPATVPVTVTVTSSDGQTTQVTITLTVNPAPPPPPPPPGTDPWVGTWRGTRTDRRVIPNQTSEYVWVLERDQFSETRQYVSFPGTDFQCTIVPSADDASFTGFCGNPLNLFYSVRGTRSGTTINGLGDRSTTAFVDDYVFTLTKQ